MEEGNPIEASHDPPLSIGARQTEVSHLRRGDSEEAVMLRRV